MKSRVVAFRVPVDVYEEFERKCRDEEVSPTMKLRELVQSSCKPTETATNDRPQVKVIHVDEEKLGKAVNTDPKKSWFPFDFSPLFGKGR